MLRLADADVFQIFLIDDLAVEQVAGEHKPAKQGVEYQRFNRAAAGFSKLLPPGAEVTEQLPVNPLLWVERFGVGTEKLARLHGQNKLADFRSLGHSV